MYRFSDYFDQDKINTPYNGTREEVQDHLHLLDMLLEGYLEFKGLASEEKLFSRGLVITESEMRKFFQKPPYERQQDQYDAALAEDAEAAWNYIATRTLHTVAPYGLAASDEETEEEQLLGGDEETGTDGVLTADGEWFAAESAPGDDEKETDDAVANLSEQWYTEEPDWREEQADNSESIRVGVLWIDSIKRIFNLDHTGVLAVIMAIASATDRRYERIYGYLQDDITRTKPTVGLLAALMSRITPSEDGEALLNKPLDESLFHSLFVMDEEESGLDTDLVLNPVMERILLGIPVSEEQMPDPITVVTEDPDIPIFFAKSAEELEHALSDAGNKFCYVESSDEEAVRHILASYCYVYDETLFVFDLDHFMRMPVNARNACLADLIMRVRLADGRVIVRIKSTDMKEIGLEQETANRRWKILMQLSRLLEENCIVIFGEEKEPGELIRHSVPFLTIPAPDVSIRTGIWTWFLQAGIADDVVIEDLADCYDISYGTIKNTCSHAKAAARIRGLDKIDREMILESLRQLSQVDFSGLANYVRAAYTWNELKINDDQRAVLRAACDRYRLRNRVGQGWNLSSRNAYGNGVSLLIYGPPGTGKTMAAQVVANELGIPLYRVDISQIFSKYIGETEKNLSVIFDAAKGANVILFFDEADALFSKRTEINNSNDKYANSETAYLLQKIEEYDGMSILATNHYTNFDPAFVRRITYSVRLDSPDEEMRYILWTTILPREAELEEGIPFRFFAEEFDLSGANIKAILYSAAYMAGAEGTAVGIRHIVRAMEYEFRKLGRFIDRDAFGKYAKYLSVPERCREATDPESKTV